MYRQPSLEAINSFNFYNHSFFGDIFFLDESCVIKRTRNQDDYIISKLIQLRPMKRFVKVLNTQRDIKTGYYYIFMEKLSELNEEECDVIRDFCVDIYEQNRNQIEYLSSKILRKHLEEYEEDSIEHQLLKVFIELYGRGFIQRDFHFGNLMMRGNKLVMIDCGQMVMNNNHVRACLAR